MPEKSVPARKILLCRGMFSYIISFCSMMLCFETEDVSLCLKSGSRASAENEAFRGATLCLKPASSASADNEAYNEAFRGATLFLKPVGRAASVNEGVSWRDALPPKTIKHN